MSGRTHPVGQPRGDSRPYASLRPQSTFGLTSGGATRVTRPDIGGYLPSRASSTRVSKESPAGTVTSPAKSTRSPPPSGVAYTLKR